MKLFYSLLLLLSINLLSFSQVPIKGDTIKLGIFYASSVEIKSDSAFPFCGNIYNFNRECEYPQPNKTCCAYSTTLDWNNYIATSGLVNCAEGNSLSWHYSPTLENARIQFESIPQQWETQQKTFSKRRITCIIFDKECEGWFIEQETFKGYKFYTLLLYSAYNGYNFILEYRPNKEIKTSDDIYPLFRQFLRIK